MRRVFKMIFSRYFFSAIIILLEFVLLFFLVYFASYYSVGAFLVMVLVDIVAMISLINREANPEYKVSWLAVMTLVPFFGVVLYLTFYSRKVSRREAALMRELRADLRSNLSTGQSDVYAELCTIDELAGGKALAIMNDDPMAEIYKGTSFTYFPLGEKMHKELLSDICKARKYIFLEYFIIEEGECWNSILEMLINKVREGVEVRVLYDDFGCMKKLHAGYDKKLRLLGIKARRFSPITPRLSTAHNNRDHRKIAVIDGEIAYTGGMNLADEYINKKVRFGHWKDGGVRIFGNAVRGFLALFLSSWDLSLGAASDSKAYFSLEDSNACDGGFYIPFGSGPSPLYSRPVCKNVFLNIINQAREYVYITTPYLIIDYDLTESLRNAARRGIDVRIITPKVADKKMVKIMTKSSYQPLIRSGVKIYEYTPGFIHEKLVVSDDLYAVIGTVNFDYRSLVHHFENAVWIYNSPGIYGIRDEFEKTLGASAEIDEEHARLTLRERLVRWGVRIIAPLL